MRRLRHFAALTSALLFLLALTAPVLTQAQTSAPQVSGTVSAELGKLRELIEAKSFAPALVLIDRLIRTVPSDSYDRALLSQIQAQVLLTEGRYGEAIAPLENAVRLGERNPPFLPDATARESLFLLAQLHQQVASESTDLASQRASLARATDYFRRWQIRTPKPTPDGQLFAASLFYQQATLDPVHIDSTALLEARRAAAEGLVLQLKPPSALYVLILAAHKQREENVEAAEILELLVDQSPDTTSYWQQLVSTYLTLASTAQHEREADTLNLRALLALERAQARKLLTSPKENFNRVALLLALRQYGPAIAVLEKGLADGSLENTRRNWEILAHSYQQSDRSAEAVAALEKAVKALPADGRLEFSLAQLLHAAGRSADARRHLELAVKKGDLDKPGQAHLFLAYLAHDLQDHAAAARHVADAAAFDDAKKEDVARLTKAIEDARRAPAPRVSKY